MSAKNQLEEDRKLKKPLNLTEKLPGEKDWQKFVNDLPNEAKKTLNQGLMKLREQKVVSLSEKEIDRAFKNTVTPIVNKRNIKKLTDRGFIFNDLYQGFEDVRLRSIRERFIKGDPITKMHKDIFMRTAEKLFAEIEQKNGRIN